MSLIPTWEIGVWNAWIFMCIYPLQWLAVFIAPKRVGERTSHAPEIIMNRQDRILAFLTQGFWIGSTVYSIFVPFQVGTGWLWAGLVFFIAGVLTIVLATFAVAATPEGRPFTSGIYRFSRHPMYFSMILVYLGVSIAAASWLFFVITIITFFLQRYQLLKEERFCCTQYGDAYREYMDKTPRWIGIPESA